MLTARLAVGVMGDTRVYGYIIILRAVTTSDFMSAEAFEFPWRLLQSIARTIVNSVDGVSRVTYDLYVSLSFSSLLSSPPFSLSHFQD